MLKLQKSFRLPNSPLSLRLRYEVPLKAIEDFYRPPARLLVRYPPPPRITLSPTHELAITTGTAEAADAIGC